MVKLNNIIDTYIKVCQSFLELFLKQKKLSAPKSNFEWSTLDIPQKGTIKNTEYFKHGFGIDFKNKDWKISIDIGDNGEWDGFDAWRLFLFIKENSIDSALQSEDEIEALLVKGVKKGIFVKRKDMYFYK